MKKLTKAQQEIVDEMYAGAELRSYVNRQGNHKHHLGNQRKKTWRDIHANIVMGLLDRGVLKIVDPDISYRREYALTADYAPPVEETAPEDGVQDAVVVDEKCTCEKPEPRVDPGMENLEADVPKVTCVNCHLPVKNDVK